MIRELLWQWHQGN